MSEPENTLADITAEELALFDQQGEEPEAEGEQDAGEERTAEADDSETAEGAEAEEAEGEEPEVQEKPPKGYVRLEALHEARENNRELRERLEKEQARISQFESLRAQLEEMRGQRSYQDQIAMNEEAQRQQRQAEELYQEDPVAFMKQQNAALIQEMQALRQQQEHFAETQQRAAQEAAQMRRLTDHVNTQEQQFRQQVPDYDDAFRFLQERRMADYAAIGITNPEEQRASLYQEILGMSGKAIQDGRNPAQVLYELAKSWGFSKEGEQPKGGESAKIGKIQRGMKAATTLSDSGGAPAGSDISLSDIERMSDAEFEKLWSELERDAG